jgi:hypothetical protein
VLSAFPDATIVRCANIVGHEDRFLNRLAGEVVAVEGRGEVVVRWIGFS